MKISITSTAQAVPAQTGGHRLVGKNTGSSTIYLGFTNTVVGTDNASQGIPIAAGEVVSIDNIDRYGRIPHLVCATGATSTFNYDFQ
jgi:hypothetical protein